MKVLNRITNGNDHGDYVKCCNCGKIMLVTIGEDKCPECGMEGSLTWMNEEKPEASIYDLELED